MSGVGNQGEGAPKRHPIIIRNPSTVPHLVQPPCFFACLPGSRRAGCPHGPHGFFSVISLATVARHRHHTAQGSSQPGKKKTYFCLYFPKPFAVLTSMNMVKSVSRLAGRPRPSHICIGAGIYRVCACSSWPGLAHVLPRPGKIEIAARPARDGPLPGPLWPSHRAAEISDILAGSGWNLRRIGRTRLTDRMLILHDCVPLGWKPSVIWSASNFFFLPSFSSQCWKYHRGSCHREPCLRTALYWRGNRHNNRYRPHCQASYIHYSSMVPGFSSTVHVGLSAQTGQAACSVKPYGYYCVHLQQIPWELEGRRNGSLRDCGSSQG